MDATEAQQIYQQRYETYRHLDRLRWQMFQIAVATGSLVLAFGKQSEVARGPSWWVLAAAGALFMCFGLVMERIRHGITANGEILRMAAEAMGDDGIPKATVWYKNVSFWIAVALIGIGILCVVLSVLRSPAFIK